MNNQQHKPASGGNGWVSCGLPGGQGEYGGFWTLWAQSRDSRKCSCGCMVITGPCPSCGRTYDAQQENAPD